VEEQEAGMNVRALVAEAVGTFVLIAMGSLGVGTAFLMSSGQSFVLMLVVPWAFGLGLVAAIAIAGETSGGHFNPAVTLASVLDGRIRWTTGLAYAVAQGIGAFAASLFILLILAKEFVGATVNHAGTIAQDALTNELHAFATEIVLTAIFVAVILTVTSRAPTRAIVVIPLTLIGIHFAGIPISGASVNPIRSLAPAVVSGDYEGLWVYLTGPFLGAIIGWGLFRLLNAPAQTHDDDEFEDDDELDDELEDDELAPA
jgi:aquaporin Z